ncbi:hypothetical protein AJ79_07735 [Helicocarpus griseus UAMH5409]|uniref:SWIM-type domain-containing protein n=1 Tax=Helicocarpus griseus UAMH5409 TaxID=1447875 RepID=A0A2B7X0A2_9EURO|nr:hypothetical protein AJ79_07735 [Helicocarpus griseus UAMH5409]
MSAPTSQLEQLSIGSNMATTRDQAQRGAETIREEKECADDSSSEEDGSESEDDTDTVQGNSEISYDLSNLSRSEKARAVSGLTGEFVVDKCRTTRDGFDFEVADHGRVHLGPGPMTCSCSDYEDDKHACRHVFWLVDQLHDLAMPRRPGPGESISLYDNGESSPQPAMYRRLGDKMEDLAKKAEWQFVPGASSPGVPGNEYGLSMTRPEKTIDILSAFSDKLPEEFRPDQVATISEKRKPEECVVQGDFEATMLRLAVHDDDVYISLRKVMPSPARAQIYFNKIQARLDTLLRDFGRYCQHGSLRRDGTALEINVVVNEVHKLVGQIEKNITLRAPSGLETASNVLASLLREVSGYNRDAFYGNDWGRVEPAGETENDRNLFTQLIGQPEVSDSYFILDILERLPREEFKKLDSVLRMTMNIINNACMPSQSVVAYLQRLQSLLNRDHPAAGSSVAAYGQKRPAAGSSGSGRKRTK